MNSTFNPKLIWDRALTEPLGCAVSETDLKEVERQLYAYRKEVGDPELFGFYIVRSETEVKVLRATNITSVRTDGEYRPLED
jgi:hypothetical protein